MFDLALTPRMPVEKLLAGLKSDSAGQSKEAAARLNEQARAAGLSMRDFLLWSVDTAAGEHAAAFQQADLNGYEAALAFLGLPVKTDLSHGVHLQAASDTFQRFPGTRALFPEVIDDMVRWKDRQDQIENTAAIVGQTRTIAGTELISTVVEDDSAERDTHTVSELGRVPVRTIKTSQSSVEMFKHGSGYRTSYEFNRRASLDIITPFASRVGRELEISKVKAATSVLINGDGVNGAAPVVNISTHGGDGAKTFRHNYASFMKFLVDRARKGNPVDTALVNFDLYIELMLMFYPSTAGQTGTPDAAFGAANGAPRLQLPTIGNGTVNIVLSSGMPADSVMCYSKADTLEELVEAGSSIAENERSILNQSVTYIRTEVTGYKLAFGDTRTLLKTNA